MEYTAQAPSISPCCKWTGCHLRLNTLTPEAVISKSLIILIIVTLLFPTECPYYRTQFLCLFKTLCPQRHSKLCFELLETFWVTPKRTCLSVICSSVVGQLRWKEHIKQHKKFLIFLIDNLNFIFLCKIRNNDRTISITVLCCLNLLY